MTPASLVRLVLLAFCWGIAFLFVRVAVPEIGPLLLAELRVLIAGLLLLVYARSLGLLPDFRRHWRLYLLLGSLNSALPFVLIAYAQLRLEASLAAVLVSTAPMFSAVLAHVAGDERLNMRKLIGLAAGVAGIALLVGWTPSDEPAGSTLSKTTAIALVLCGALVYAIAAVYTRGRSGRAPGLILAAGSQLGAAALLLPLVPLAWPAAVPGAQAIACTLALALVSSAFAFVLYFRLIADVGPVKTLTVNFLAPVFGVAGGVIVLGEPLTVSMLAGAAVTLGGIWLTLDLRARR